MEDRRGFVAAALDDTSAERNDGQEER